MRLLLGIALASAVISPAQAQKTDVRPAFSLTTGVDYSTGDYGDTQNTEIVVVPVSARLRAGAWSVTAELHYLDINGARSIVGGGGGGPIVIGGATARLKRHGMGDVTLGVAWSALAEEKAPFNLELGARVKLPTASSRDDLGTGKFDFAISADISRTFGAATPFVTVGYRIAGDPAGIDLKNTLSASIGTSIVLGKLVAIISYDHRQSASASVRDGHEIFGALSGALTQRLDWTLYGSAGLGDGSPDAAAGLMLTAKF